MADKSQLASTSSQAMDLRINKTRSPLPDSQRKTGSKIGNGEYRHKNRSINIFKKHKLKYRYLHKRHRHEKTKHASDSGQFGSGSMQGSSSTTSNEKRSTNDSTSSAYTSSSPSSGASDSPLNLVSGEVQPSASDHPMCMMLRHAVPLVVMMQGQLQSNMHNSAGGTSLSDTTLFKCNMCSMFSNNLNDVLNHVNTNHSSVHYCFVCNQFHNSKTEYDRHKSICDAAHEAFQQIVGSHYHGSSQNRSSGTQEQALNLSVAGNVAMRAAQIIHNKKGRQSKIKKLQKCTYCKKAFFGRFYLQRHLRSHTGEKLCHCTICGKGFAEWRNLRNHMSRFHNSSMSSESGGQSKSVSPNMTSDSDNRSNRSNRSNKATSTRLIGRSNSVPVSKSSSLDLPAQQSTTSSMTSSSPPQLSNSTEFSHPREVLPTWPSTSSASLLNEYRPDSCSPNALTTDPGGTSFYSAESTATQSQCESSQSKLVDVKPVAANLGSTSSRLQLSSSESLESSLNPVCAENGDKIFKCTMCNKTFRTKFAMQRHLDFHADKRPFQCDQCDYKAKTKPQLKVHVMRHSGEKGFNCRICNYACVTHSDLNRHCKSRSHLFRVSVLEQKGRGDTSVTSDCNSRMTNTDNSSQDGSLR